MIQSKKIDLNCVICEVLSKSYEEWELHVTSERHVENAKRCKQVTSVEIPSPIHQPLIHPIQQQEPSPASSIIPPLLPPHELMELTAKFQHKLNQEALQQIVATNKKEWNCVNCNVTCQSLCSWEAHQASIKHRKNKHKFHTYPGISKEFIKRKYQNSFVRAAETIGELIKSSAEIKINIIKKFQEMNLSRKVSFYIANVAMWECKTNFN